MSREVITDGRLLSGVPSNILRGIVPTVTLWDGQVGFAYQAKTGGTVFTDFTAAANNATANDVTFFDATMQAQDAFYFGENFATSGPFNTLLINTGTAANVSATLVWEYYDSVGTAWTAIPSVSDATVGLTVTGSKYVTWPDIATMGHVAVNGQDRYWVRLRVSAFTSKTTAPLGTQIWLGNYPTSLINVTDGSTATVSSAGAVLTAAFLSYGNTVFDLGNIKAVMIYARLGLWSSAGNHTVIIDSSDDGSTYRSAVPSTGIQMATSATELITEATTKILIGRYIRFRFQLSAASTGYVKMYEIKAYELGA